MRDVSKVLLWRFCVIPRVSLGSWDIKLHVLCDVSWHITGVRVAYTALLLRWHGVSFME